MNISPTGTKEHIVILLRHGESAWNNENKWQNYVIYPSPKKSWLFSRFCGWVDVGLSNRGDSEAVMAAEALLESGINISRVFTSLLTRANFTVSRVLEVVLKKMFQFFRNLEISRNWHYLNKEKVVRDWRLNERHYGALTGLNKGDDI